MAEGIGNVIDARMIEFRDYDNFLAAYASERWVDWFHSETRIRWRDEVAEVKRFRYATDTRTTSNSSNPHSHNTHLPKLGQIGDTLEAHYMDALFPHDQWLQFIPGDLQAAKSEVAKLVEHYMRSRHRLSDHTKEMARVLKDWVDEGNCFAEAIWSSKAASNENGLMRKSYIGPTYRNTTGKYSASHWSFATT